jgi:threonine aldolase
MKAGGVLALPTGPRRVRFVCHLDVDAAMIDRAIGVIASAAA